MFQALVADFDAARFGVVGGTDVALLQVNTAIPAAHSADAKEPLRRKIMNNQTVPLAVDIPKVLDLISAEEFIANSPATIEPDGGFAPQHLPAGDH